MVAKKSNRRQGGRAPFRRYFMCGSHTVSAASVFGTPM
jgi:hypothetical protein